jgi:hypothetical protein
MNYDPNSRARQKILREAANYRTLRSIYGKDGLERIELVNGLPKTENDWLDIRFLEDLAIAH